MRKKSLNIILLVILVLSMLVVLTGCGDEDKTKSSSRSNAEVSSRSEASSPEEFIEQLVNDINNGNVENIIDSIDIVGMYAFNMSLGSSEGGYVSSAIGYESSYEPKEYDVMKFENAYELVESIKDDSIENVIKEYEGNTDYYLFEAVGKEVLTEKLSEQKEEIYDSIIGLKARIRMLYTEQLESVNIELEEIGKAKKQTNSDSLYKVSVELSGNTKVNGENQSFEDEDDVYIMEKDGEYYLVWSKWMGVNNNVRVKSNKSVVKLAIESALKNCKHDFYADDDYEYNKFSETVTEADFCEGINSFTQGMEAVKDLDTSKKYYYDDQYSGSNNELLVDVDKVYIIDNYSSYPEMEYYYVTFKEGNNGSIEIDELKHYVDGKWGEIKEEEKKREQQNSTTIEEVKITEKSSSVDSKK